MEELRTARIIGQNKWIKQRICFLVENVEKMLRGIYI